MAQYGVLRGRGRDGPHVMQASSVWAALLAYLPSAQAKHSVWPTLEYAPSAHGSHFLYWLVILATVPGSQLEQFSCPSCWYLPTAHGAHSWLAGKHKQNF